MIYPGGKALNLSDSEAIALPVDEALSLSENETLSFPSSEAIGLPVESLSHPGGEAPF